LKNKLHIFWASTKLYATALSRFGATGNVIPTIVAFSGKDNQKKPYAWDEKKPITKEGAIEWLNDVIEGKAKGFRKSQPVPENKDEPVVTVVGDTFESIVYDDTKDVLLEIYATWCGHCKMLAPIYKKVGKAFKSIKSVVIAKLEGVENGYPENIYVEGFPTIYLFPANAKDKPIPFEGERTVAGFSEFIKQHASIPFEGKDQALDDKLAEELAEDEITPEGEDEIEGEEIFDEEGEGEIEGEGEGEILPEGEEIFEDDDGEDSKEQFKDEL